MPHQQESFISLFELDFSKKLKYSKILVLTYVLRVVHWYVGLTKIKDRTVASKVKCTVFMYNDC